MDRAEQNTPFPRLETERLILRRITPDDTDEVFRLFSNRTVARYLDFPVLKRVEGAKEIVAWCQKIWEERTGLRFGLERKGDDGLVGTCGFHNWAHRDFRADIGYDLLPTCWGRGLMREALTRVIHYGVEEMALHRIQAMVNPANERSQRLLERLGFTREGTLREWRFYRGEFWDEVCYSLLEQDVTDLR